MQEIPPRYNPKELERKWCKTWEEKGYFSAELDPQKKPYCIVIPPPNITGILHMGHALNNTIQDILIRWKRMDGFCALWMPGTDHAGIATQNVVERELEQEGINRQDLGREGFLERVWKWKQEYGSTIIHQLKRLGCSCDWQRLRFTMDEGYCEAVKEVFLRLHKKGLIYQGDYIINWCPRCQTALSDEEAPYKEVQGFLYYIKYPITSVVRPLRGGSASLRSRSSLATRKKDKQVASHETRDTEYVVVATTRPETMLGDVAVAVNPKDKRYKNLLGGTIVLPLLDRQMKFIEDKLVDPKFGTGAVKVTPAHDPNDFIMGQKHNLQPILVMNPDGTMNENAGGYCGMDRFEAREAILEDLKERNLLLKVEPHIHSVGHCYRCHTVIEPYLSRQWFVKMGPLAKPAIEAVKSGRIKFHPPRWTKVYLNWMENIKDWCISRQIWWGHRIPIEGEEDVLDTWFSSWLWPFATFGWPFNSSPVARDSSLAKDKELKAQIQKQKAELEYFYPTDCLVTAQEIIFFWVARMIMAGLEFAGDIPFKDVYIHGTVRDATGTKMSKSLGNIIDPLEIIDEFGGDALRFSIISITASGQDIFLSKEKFKLGRNFANKIWNVSRFVLMNLGGQAHIDSTFANRKEGLKLPERWILSRLNATLVELNRCLRLYRFNEAANCLYDFMWHQFCDWYVEISKQTIKDRDTQVCLYKVLETSMRMLHPFIPFITEEIWSRLPHETESIMISPWPQVQEALIEKEADADMQLIIDIITNIRNIRAEMSVPLAKQVNTIVSVRNKRLKELLETSAPYIKQLGRVEQLKVGLRASRPRQSATAVVDEVEVFVPLAGIIDIGLEKKRLSKRIDEAKSAIQQVTKMLKTKGFLAKAPKQVVEQQKAKQQQMKTTLDKLKSNLKSLE